MSLQLYDSKFESVPVTVPAVHSNRFRTPILSCLEMSVNGGLNSGKKNGTGAKSDFSAPIPSSVSLFCYFRPVTSSLLLPFCYFCSVTSVTSVTSVLLLLLYPCTETGSCLCFVSVLPVHGNIISSFPVTVNSNLFFRYSAGHCMPSAHHLYHVPVLSLPVLFQAVLLPGQSCLHSTKIPGT